MTVRYLDTPAGAADASKVSSPSTPSHPDPLPGSRTAEFLAATNPYLVPTYAMPNSVFVRGRGATLVDMEGRSYLDWTCGYAVTNLGHADADTTALVAEQAGLLLQSCSGFYNEHAGPLARLLVERTLAAGCMPGAAAVGFANGGAEAVETALRHARRVGFESGGEGKRGIVSFSYGYHGRSYGAMSASLGDHRAAAPLVPAFRMGVYNDASGLDELITADTCGVIVEPVQGVGGVVVASEDFLVAVARRCRAVGAVLIYDEVHCGMGRSGHLWSFAPLPPAAHPDIVVFAKAIGNGYPMGGVLVTRAVLAHLRLGDTGSTLAGNPLACRIGRHTVDRCSDPAVLARVRAKGALLVAGFRAIAARHPGKIVDVRGPGLLLGVEVKGDPQVVVDAARVRGLLVLWSEHNTVRVCPNLAIGDDDLALGLERFEAAIAASEW
jgi:acetylornithine aminotransferase